MSAAISLLVGGILFAASIAFAQETFQAPARDTLPVQFRTLEGRPSTTTLERRERTNTNRVGTTTRAHEIRTLLQRAQEARQSARERTAALRERASAQQHELTRNVRTEVAARVHASFERILTILSNTLERLSATLVRIDGHIVTLADDGVDVRAASELHTTAEAALGEALDALDKARESVVTLLEADNPGAVREEARAAIREATAATRTAYRALKEVLQELRAHSPTHTTSDE